MLKVLHNFILNKSIIRCDKDPPWFHKQSKILTERKNDLFKNYMNNGRLESHYARLQNADPELTHLVRSSKEQFCIKLAKKLSNLSISSKPY